MKDYGYPEQDRVRSRMVVSIENSTTPLRYKVTLETQLFQGGDSWVPFQRVFAADRDSLSCLRERLKM